MFININRVNRVKTQLQITSKAVLHDIRIDGIYAYMTKDKTKYDTLLSGQTINIDIYNVDTPITISISAWDGYDKLTKVIRFQA